MSGSLAHSPADILRTLLIDLGLGTAPGGTWPIHVPSEPDTPDNTITLRIYGSELHGRSQIDGEVFEHYDVQVRVRHTYHYAGWQKINAILRALDTQVTNVTVSVGDDAGTGSATYTVYSCRRKAGVNDLGYDTPRTKRSVFTMNVVLSLRQRS